MTENDFVWGGGGESRGGLTGLLTVSLLLRCIKVFCSRMWFPYIVAPSASFDGLKCQHGMCSAHGWRWTLQEVKMRMLHQHITAPCLIVSVACPDVNAARDR